MNTNSKKVVERLNPSASSIVAPMKMTQSISIVRKQRRPSNTSYPLTDDEQISRYMYDNATWRMYNRIMNDRKKRAKIAKQLGLQLEDYSHQSTGEKQTLHESKSTTNAIAPNCDEQLMEEDGMNWSETQEDSQIWNTSSIGEDVLQEEGIFQMEI